MASSGTKLYLYQLRPYIILASILFASFFMIGYVVGELLQFGILKEFGEVFQWITELNPIILMLFIFLNNSVKSFFAILLGFIFAIAPLLFVTTNGLLIGMVVSDAIREGGVVFVLSAILPHGIVEIPVFLLSVAIGLRMGVQTVLKLDGKDVELRFELKKALRFFVLYILSLFLLSAFLEVFVTSFFISISL
ncbi:MAG: stage II sporulation protein M [Nitrososphaerales archaeon]|nr:stage II sporulation protein M [Nitrososphaerales archaeon]